MAASETVRVSRRTRQLLERLRASVTLETGRKVTIQEIVDAAVSIAARRREELLRELGAWRPLAREEAERLLDELAIDADVEDVERDLREALYSDGAA